MDLLMADAVLQFGSDLREARDAASAWCRRDRSRSRRESARGPGRPPRRPDLRRRPVNAATAKASRNNVGTRVALPERFAYPHCRRCWTLSVPRRGPTERRKAAAENHLRSGARMMIIARLFRHSAARTMIHVRLWLSVGTAVLCPCPQTLFRGCGAAGSRTFRDHGPVPLLRDRRCSAQCVAICVDSSAAIRLRRMGVAADRRADPTAPDGLYPCDLEWRVVVRSVCRPDIKAASVRRPPYPLPLFSGGQPGPGSSASGIRGAAGHQHG